MSLERRPGTCVSHGDCRGGVLAYRDCSGPEPSRRLCGSPHFEGQYLTAEFSDRTRKVTETKSVGLSTKNQQPRDGQEQPLGPLVA